MSAPLTRSATKLSAMRIFYDDTQQSTHFRAIGTPVGKRGAYRIIGASEENTAQSICATRCGPKIDRRPDRLGRLARECGHVWSGNGIVFGRPRPLLCFLAFYRLQALAGPSFLAHGFCHLHACLGFGYPHCTLRWGPTVGAPSASCLIYPQIATAPTSSRRVCFATITDRHGQQQR